MLMRRGQKLYNDFKFGTFIGRFPSDCAASMAVKGLMSQVMAGQEVESEVGQRQKKKRQPNLVFELATRRHLAH